MGIKGIRGIMGIRGIRGISSSHSHSHSHSLTITNNGGGLRPPPQRWAAASRRPTFVESIVGDGEAVAVAVAVAVAENEHGCLECSARRGFFGPRNSTFFEKRNFKMQF